MSQQGKFFAGVFGLPIRIKLVNGSGTALMNSEIDPDTDIEAITLEILRPDGTTITPTLDLNDCIKGSDIEYVPADGEMNVGGRYAYNLTLDLTGDRQLPVSGTFHIAPLEFTDS
jgi:hypothetical protein